MGFRADGPPSPFLRGIAAEQHFDRMFDRGVARGDFGFAMGYCAGLPPPMAFAPPMFLAPRFLGAQQMYMDTAAANLEFAAAAQTQSPVLSTLEGIAGTVSLCAGLAALSRDMFGRRECFPRFCAPQQFMPWGFRR